MDHVVDFVGTHKESNILSQLIGGKTYQPIELDEVLDEEDYNDLKTFLDSADKIYLFIDNSDGPKSHKEIFNSLCRDFSTISVTETL